MFSLKHFMARLLIVVHTFSQAFLINRFFFISQAIINSTITPNMTFTKTSHKFGQWADSRANTVYGLGFSTDHHLAKVGGILSLSLSGRAISHFLPCVSGGLVLHFFRSLPPPVFLNWGTPTHCALMRSCTVIGAWEASSVQCFPLFRSLYLSLLCIMMMHCQELGVENLINTFRLPPLSFFLFSFTLLYLCFFCFYICCIYFIKSELSPLFIYHFENVVFFSVRVFRFGTHMYQTNTALF